MNNVLKAAGGAGSMRRFGNAIEVPSLIKRLKCRQWCLQACRAIATGQADHFVGLVERAKLSDWLKAVLGDEGGELVFKQVEAQLAHVRESCLGRQLDGEARFAFLEVVVLREIGDLLSDVHGAVFGAPAGAFLGDGHDENSLAVDTAMRAVLRYASKYLAKQLASVGGAA